MPRLLRFLCDLFRPRPVPPNPGTCQRCGGAPAVTYAPLDPGDRAGWCCVACAADVAATRQW